jgi:DNA-binding NtrC family response regulator
VTAELLNNNSIVGESPAMRTLNCQIATAARSDLTVLITGESGTGKELVARAVHQRSSRCDRPFISVNCGALTETLLESELFGYRRGAFTGAHQNQRGLFEAAHGGTIFLDEIGELSPACQVKLLRVLQEGAVRPVGAHAEISIDVRVIAATNRSLSQEMTIGRFREDLFYRIAVLTIKTPSLRERSTDIPLLVKYFLDAAERRLKLPRPVTVEREGLSALTMYTWHGNVRQLRHVVERLVAGARGAVISSEEVRETLSHTTALLDNAPQVPLVILEGESLDDFLDRTLLGLYGHVRSLVGTHTEAARFLRADRVSLYQRLERARQRINRKTLAEQPWLDA